MHWRSTWASDTDFRRCPKRGCGGTLIHCITTYYPRGPMNNELECSNCSLVKRDPKFKRGRNNRAPQQRPSNNNHPRFNSPRTNQYNR
jgi:hypothetical protein